MPQVSQHSAALNTISPPQPSINRNGRLPFGPELTAEGRFSALFGSVAGSIVNQYHASALPGIKRALERLAQPLSKLLPGRQAIENNCYRIARSKPFRERRLDRFRAVADDRPHVAQAA